MKDFEAKIQLFPFKLYKFHNKFHRKFIGFTKKTLNNSFANIYIISVLTNKYRNIMIFFRYSPISATVTIPDRISPWISKKKFTEDNSWSGFALVNFLYHPLIEDFIRKKKEFFKKIVKFPCFRIFFNSNWIPGFKCISSSTHIIISHYNALFY